MSVIGRQLQHAVLVLMDTEFLARSSLGGDVQLSLGVDWLPICERACLESPPTLSITVTQEPLICTYAEKAAGFAGCTLRTCCSYGVAVRKLRAGSDKLH